MESSLSCIVRVNPLSVKLTKWPNTLKQFVANLPTNCLSVLGHFMGLALKGLNIIFLGLALSEIQSSKFFILFHWCFALKIYGTLKMFLFSVPNDFYIIFIEFICRRACEKNLSLNFISLVVIQASKLWMFFRKLIV